MEYRSDAYQRDLEVEAILGQLSNLLVDVGSDIKFESDFPVIFIVGCPRSGSTVLSQYLSQATSFCYPSNFISRFYYNPYLGAKLQYLLFDLDRHGELFGKISRDQKEFTSNLGKTSGALSPHEFWYFWRRFFHFSDIQKLSEDAKSKVDQIPFLNGIKAIQSVFKQPIFLKAHILNWDLDLLADLVPNSYFIFMRRQLEFNAYSILQARRVFRNDVTKWYSFKPPEYDRIILGTPAEQVVDQVHHTNKAIQDSLSQLTKDRSINIGYEEFCAEPSILLDRIRIKLQIEFDSFGERVGHHKIENRNFALMKGEDKTLWKNIINHAASISE